MSNRFVRKTFLQFAGVVSACASIAQAAPTPKNPPQVRVRIVEAANRLEVRGVDLGLNSTRRGSKGFRISTERISEWSVKCSGPGRVEASLRKPVQPGLKPWIFKEALQLESPSGFITLEDRSFRDKIVIHPVQVGNRWQCEVVNHVDVEKYLDGLVNSEFNSKWKPEAVDAQVIAARTYAYYQMAQAKKRGLHYDVESTVKDQVYDGAHKEDFRSSLSAQRTKGLILTRPGSQAPIKAYYHSTCGGLTELPENVWGNKDKAFKRRANCAYCQPSPTYLWETNLDAKKIVQALLKQSEKPTPEEQRWIKRWPKDWRNEVKRSTLESIQVVDQTPGGRAKTVKLVWRRDQPAKGTPALGIAEAVAADAVQSTMSSSLSVASNRDRFELDLSAPLFRIWSDPVVLKSTAFQVFAAGKGQFLVRGRGYGHGVGLCQWGAKGMAESGKNHRSILKLYYPDAVLTRAW